MVKAGDTLHNPLSGETFIILKTAADTQGALFQMETRVPVNGGTHVPPHLHPAHTMRLTIVRGAMKFWMGKPESEKICTTGAKLTISTHTPYHWTITGNDELRFVTEFEPAGEWEHLFESMSAIGRAATRGGAKRLNPVLASMSVLNRRRDHMYFSVMPVSMQKVLFAGVAFIAKLFGYADDYGD